MSDDPRLRFILDEIELGITLVGSASISYESSDDDEHGYWAEEQAIKALESVRRFIGYLDAHGQHVARAELPRLEKALKELAERATQH